MQAAKENRLATVTMLATQAAVLVVTWRLLRLHAKTQQDSTAAVEGYVTRDLYERAVEARDRLDEAIRTQILPAMDAAANANRASFAVLSELYRARAPESKPAGGE